MSYRVLARKHRSRTFDEVLGQAAIATTLKNAVTSGRIHHGYLFTGTRGVGKTSMARILAKALNCQAFQAPTPTPCGECESCRLISEGEDLDVIEIDAASNNGVDNIRELRSNANFRPARSRFKIYIIDEVHMLSTPAFNALLKTLEEPPGHVKFILATTESHKVPATIQSRCQRFDFRSLDVETIAAHLRDLIAREKLNADEHVIRRVAKLARGSMRDALSLLDQLLSFGGDKLTPEIVDEILPTAHEEVICDLLDRIVEADSAGALACVEKGLASGHTPERFCDAVIEHLRTLMLLNVCGADTNLVDLTAQLHGRLAEQSKGFDASTYVYLITLCEELRRSTRSSGMARALLDAGVVRMAMASKFSDVTSLLARLEGNTGADNPADSKKKSLTPAPPTSVPTGSRASPVTALTDSSLRLDVQAVVPVRSIRTAVTAAPSAAPSVQGEDKKRVLAQPLVRRAMELFDGQIAGIRKAPVQPSVKETLALPLADEGSDGALSLDGEST